LEYRADLSQIPEKEKSEVMQGLRDVIERRVNIFGVTESVVQVYGEDRLVVELPGVESIESAINWIGQTPLLEFMEEKPAEEIQAIIDKSKEIAGKTPEEIQAIDNWMLAFESPYQETGLTGRYLKKLLLVLTKQPMLRLLSFNLMKKGLSCLKRLQLEMWANLWPSF